VTAVETTGPAPDGWRGAHSHSDPPCPTLGLERIRDGLGLRGACAATAAASPRRLHSHGTLDVFAAEAHHLGLAHAGQDGDVVEFLDGVGEAQPLRRVAGPDAAHRLLARVIAARPAALRRLRALAVDHRHCRAGLASGALAVENDEVVVQRHQHAAVAQPSEPAVDRSPRR
jgi:hypothetical protein